ncbi:hypothetical protein A9Q98_09055 [Thalassotalea sp. 42_200_T64]|nr:hypothetical protein A9Q98_09055 [Thalassotalea sp. 42_200_T64]
MKQEEQINQDTDKIVKPTRRKFLTRTAAGIVVASIPAKSVFANNVVNSIIASGHASDFAGGDPIELLGPCAWLEQDNYWTDISDMSFNSIFGEGPATSLISLLQCFCCTDPLNFGNDDDDDHDNDNDDGHDNEDEDEDNDDGDDDDDTTATCADDNGYLFAPQMIAMYLNAIVHYNTGGNGPFGLNYPILQNPEDLNSYIQSLIDNRFNLAAIIEEHGGDADPSNFCNVSGNVFDDDD